PTSPVQKEAAPESPGTMRPTAPSFQINVPAEPPAPAPSHAETKSQVPQSQARPPQPPPGPESPFQPAPSVRGRAIGGATVKMGSPTSPGGASAPAYAPPPAGAKRPSPPVQRTTASTAPQLPSNAQPSPFAATQLAGPSRPKLGKDAQLAPSKQPVAPPPAAGEEGLLTLELGSSSASTEANHRAPSTRSTAQGLAPAAAQAMHTAGVAAARPVPEASDLEGVGTLLNDLDDAFGAIVNGQTQRLRASESPPPNSSIAELRELFTQLAANHMRQVRDFMIAVRWGEAPRDWIPICEPAVTSLTRAAKEMELAELSASLVGYGAALRRTAESEGATIAGETRDLLLAEYEKLAAEMPDAFGLDGERGRREAIIVHALLQQVPEVRKATIDKIYAAGLTSLDVLFLAKPDEISATTGIGESIASSIVEKFQRYRAEIAGLADATRAAERRRLGELAVELRGLHEQFETVTSDWLEEEHARKKRVRLARAEALLQVKVLLARLGEVERLNRIERLPFERKIMELEGYLREAEPPPAS
ncbi:MAG TPA: helix-hairpin-helix domain-containing protein, partial [Polyangiaceae bacterium]|nr:helix-hairpin-helix domain-containing protein [Polyangiaceae bacterium]